jgi:transposase-like protein
MGEQKRLRRDWTKEEKIFFAKLLQVPLKCGRPKSVGEVSKEYGISPKLLYEWLKRYTKEGESGFNQKSRKVYESISKDVELTHRLLALSLLHPDWSAKKLIDGLQAEDHEAYLPSIPTVLKILRQNNLETVDKRYGAAERAYVKGDVPLPNTLIDSLFEHNPYLKLFQSNRRIKGLVFLLRAISLSHYSGKSNGHLLTAIEVNSWMTFGRYWDGKDASDLEKLVACVSALASGKTASDIYFLAQDKNIVNKLNGKINWIDKFTDGIEIYFDSIKPQLNGIKRFLRSYEFIDAKKLDQDFDKYTFRLNFSTSYHGYPTFGEPPFNALKNHQERIKI